VNSQNNKKDMKQYLYAVIAELEKNAEKFDQYAKWIHKSTRYENYIQSNDPNALNKDSLASYIMSTGIYPETYPETNADDYGCGYLGNISYVNNFTTHAFEMFKSSGAMRQVKDKELLLYIWGAYTQLESVKDYIEKYFQTKDAEVTREIQLLVAGKPVDVPMQVFFQFDRTSTLEVNCSFAAKSLRNTVSKLKASKLVK